MLSSTRHEEMSTRLQLPKHLERRGDEVLSLTIPKGIIGSFSSIPSLNITREEDSLSRHTRCYSPVSGKVPTIIIPYNGTVTPCPFSLKVH